MFARLFHDSVGGNSYTVMDGAGGQSAIWCDGSGGRPRMCSLFSDDAGDLLDE